MGYPEASFPSQYTRAEPLFNEISRPIHERNDLAECGKGCCALALTVGGAVSFIFGCMKIAANESEGDRDLGVFLALLGTAVVCFNTGLGTGIFLGCTSDKQITNRSLNRNVEYI